ncbi:MAG: hypothetical protein ACK4YP_14125 [Myxococcota bacterium]
MRPLLLLCMALTALPAFAGHGRHDEHGREWTESHGIPNGHLPPPGSCRVWFPGEPPGHQPPPTRCAAAFRDAPRGAWVVERRDGDVAVVRAHVPRPRRPETRPYTVVYEVAGVFVRVEWR